MTSFRKIISLAVSLVLLFGSISVPTHASDNAEVELYRSSYYLNSYRAWLEPQDDGVIDVIVDVQGTSYMEDIGATLIYLYESVNEGKNWELVRAYASALTPSMLTHNDFLYFDTAVSYQGIPGRLYQAIVTVYAGDSTGNDSREYTTPPAYARY